MRCEGLFEFIKVFNTSRQGCILFQFSDAEKMKSGSEI